MSGRLQNRTQNPQIASGCAKFCGQTDMPDATSALSAAVRSKPLPSGLTKAECAVTAESIAKAPGGRSVGGGWMARCSAHDGQEPSLSIRQAHDGKILVRCHAGCNQAQLIAVPRSRGLWQDSHRQPQTDRGRQYGPRSQSGKQGSTETPYKTISLVGRLRQGSKCSANELPPLKLGEPETSPPALHIPRFLRRGLAP